MMLSYEHLKRGNYFEIIQPNKTGLQKKSILLHACICDLNENS